MDFSNLALLHLSNSDRWGSGTVPEMIHILRKHLGMDIAFLGEFFEGNREIKLVDTDEANCLLQPGLASPAEETYCKLIVDGKLPALMNDINDYPVAVALAVTAALEIKSYIAAPIHLADGTVYGTLCCYSHVADYSLNRRDLAMMQACAEMTAHQVDHQRSSTNKQREAKARIRSILSAQSMVTMYQPIHDLDHRRVAGFEALTRFKDYPDTRPDILFNEAQNIGLGPELEGKAIQLALANLGCFDSHIYVAVNISPEAVLNRMFQDIFADMPLDRVTLEITEHAAVERYQEIKTALAPLRRRGMMLAVDDAGAGFSTFRHILELAPDRIKLDMSLTKNIDTDPGRRALVAAFVRFAKDTGSKLIAEGVETNAELQALKDLGITKVQGNYLGAPMTLNEARQAAQGI